MSKCHKCGKQDAPYSVTIVSHFEERKVNGYSPHDPLPDPWDSSWIKSKNVKMCGNCAPPPFGKG